MPIAANVVLVGVGNNVQALIDAAPAGAIFYFAAGTYTNVSELAPKSGQVFDGGNRTAILDGQGTFEHAFSSSTTSNVTIRGFTIQNYATPLQDGAIQSFGTTYWTIENNHITLNAATAVATDTRARVLNNLLDWNGQAGYAAHGEDILYDGNEIAFNNHNLAIDATWEAGGGKAWGTINAVFSNNYCHDNGGNGLWDDTNNIGITYDSNVCDNNWGAGIYREIGYEGTVVNNVVRWNGMPTAPAGGENLGWMWNAGIQVRSCRPVNSGLPIIIENNIVIDNYNGISLMDSPFPATTGPPEALYGELYLGNVVVQNNYISQNTGASGVVQDSRGAAVFTDNPLWTGNTYHTSGAHPPGEISNWHVWANGERSFAEWQGYGHDLAGSETSGIAVDSSSPARVNITGNGSVSTTAAFNPPANSLLLFCGTGDASGLFTSITNNGVPLKWIPISNRNIDEDFGSPQGTAQMAYAVSPRPRTGMTVTAIYSETVSTSVKLYVITGADTFTPIGTLAEGTSTSATTTTTAYTSQKAGSLSFVTTADFSRAGVQSSSDTTLDAGPGSPIIGAASGYKTVATAGASVTHDIQVGAAPTLNWVVAEIRKSAQ